MRLSRAPPKVVLSYALLMDTHCGPLTHACFQSGKATGGLGRVWPQRGGSRQLLAEGGREAYRGSSRSPCCQVGGDSLGGSSLCRPRPALYLGRVGGCLLGVISQALGGPFQTPKYLLHLLPSTAVSDKNSFLFPSWKQASCPLLELSAFQSQLPAGIWWN